MYGGGKWRVILPVCQFYKVDDVYGILICPRTTRVSLFSPPLSYSIKSQVRPRGLAPGVRGLWSTTNITNRMYLVYAISYNSSSQV